LKCSRAAAVRASSPAAPATGAPNAMTIFVGTAPKISAFAMAMRLLVDGLLVLAIDWQQMLIVLAVLSLAIVVALGYLAARNPVRFDWTETGVHSLSDQTRKVLDGLERDVQVTALYSIAQQLEVEPILERRQWNAAFASHPQHQTRRPKPQRLVGNRAM